MQQPQVRAAVLIDSNVFIAAEDHGAGHALGANAANLIRLANELGYELVVKQWNSKRHPRRSS